MTTNEVRPICGSEEKVIVDKTTGIRTLRYRFESTKGAYVFYNLNFINLHLVSCSKLDREGKVVIENVVLPEAPIPTEQHSLDTTQRYVENQSFENLSIQIESPKLNIGEMVDKRYLLGIGKVTIDYNSWKDGYVLRTSKRDFLLPEYIYSQYYFGQRCFKTGAVTVSVGSALTVVGGVLYGIGMSKLDNPIKAGPLTTAGGALLGIGGTCIGVSIPLMCFGDHMKRESNIDFSIFNTER